jgi:hypothetical protein
MSEEQQKKPANITREELYRQVWATPMYRLGTKYGLSGNGLKKICDRLDVPYPPRGYWAKLSVGKSVRQTPLPKPLAGIPLQVTVTPTLPTAAPEQAPELDPDTAECLGEASAKTSGITVPATLRRPHRTIADWITRHEREIADARRDRSRFGFALQPKPFSSLERRRQLEAEEIQRRRWEEEKRLPRGTRETGSGPQSVAPVATFSCRQFWGEE